MFFLLLLQRRTEKDKVDLMTFKEIRERLANRETIREKQEIEERAEAEHDRELERSRRVADREQQAAAAAAAASMTNTTTAAADTSSEVAKKVKEKFLKETSRVIVKVLSPFRGADVKKGQIRTNEDFKHLAKKVLLLGSSSIQFFRIWMLTAPPLFPSS